MRARPNSLRAHPNHHERGEEVLVAFTFSALARIAGVSVATAKKDASGKGRRFNPRVPESVIRWIIARRPDLATP
jgi:hypothetical protein